ncbi:MAG: type II toxin-antitoxin system MqsA family antitoxin [Ignavibacteriales bacterium]|nr:type II toxin-antitoxin system MqsA family antitoxin [Ignavibacteriales bacterium]
MNTVCQFCGNKNFTKKHVQYIYRRGGQILLFNNVPAEVCDYCGEEYFDSVNLKKIEHESEQILSSKKKSKRSIDVPVQEFTEIAQ